VLDLGASTGGFTDCALRHGAKLVFAVDVGTGQLHPALVGHPQVKSLEQLHFKDLNLSHIDDTPVDFILIDLSFISLMLVFPLLSAFLKNGGQVVALIKPQFELQSKVRWKGGIVRDKKTRIAAAEAVVEAALQAGFQFLGMTETDVEDDSRKNQEFLALFRIG
jgi:23S rRNA (cytidine1920-2'-O)/16S rRNA (cytidine1409-2'-O)-methyltransferase